MAELRAGDRVRVKSGADIASMLDAEGRLDGLPFMPEMLEHCGRVFTVSRSAHKTCDTVHKTGGLSLVDCVHLDDLRCTGAAHGGCEALCLYFWKNAWLEPVAPDALDTPDSGALMLAPRLTVSTETAGRTRYLCQATLLPEFTHHLPWWLPSQYIHDITSGNLSLNHFFSTVVLQTLRNLMSKPGYRIWRALYNLAQGPLGGVPIEHETAGAIPVGKPTPIRNLGLEVGDLVEVCSYEEIHATLNGQGKNRGMRYDIEMRPYSGGQFRVAGRVNRIIDEVTGELLEMKTPSVILDGVYCESRFSGGRLFCPRRLPQFWREAWLKRIEEIPLRDLTDGASLVAVGNDP